MPDISDARTSLWLRFVGMQINLLVFDRTPEPLDKDIVPPCALAIHRDFDFCVFQYLREVG